MASYWRKGESGGLLENSKIFWFKTLFKCTIVHLLILFFFGAESDQRLISFSSFKDNLPECGWVNTVPRGTFLFFYQMGIHQGHPDLPRFTQILGRHHTGFDPSPHVTIDGSRNRVEIPNFLLPLAILEGYHVKSHQVQNSVG